MIVVRLDSADLRNFGFHEASQRAFGFPSFYGKNMNAWIDCMTSLDDPDDGLTQIHCAKGEVVAVHVEHADQLSSEILSALNECAAFVNWRRVEAGELPVLALSYQR